jgi:hypothetical protein
VQADFQRDMAAAGAGMAAGGHAGVKHPLQAASITFLTCDLRAPDPTSPGGLIPALTARGFDTSVPTLWTAEGILYFLPGGCWLLRSAGALASSSSSSSLHGFARVHPRCCIMRPLGSFRNRRHLQLHMSHGATWGPQISCDS